MAAQLPGDGRLLTDYSKREMQRIQWVRAEGPPHYGLGCEIWPTGRRQLFGHGAGFNGYRGMMRLDSKHKLGVVLFCNALGVPISQMTEDIYHTLYFFLAGKHQPSKTVKAGKNFSNYQGRFTGRWDEIELINLGSTLWAFSPAQSKPMKFAMRLKQVNSKTFTIMTGDSFDYIGENITFSFDKKGKANTIHFGPNRLTKFT
jgi:D-alanyl-D-alanine carboxypeptidase